MEPKLGKKSCEYTGGWWTEKVGEVNGLKKFPWAQRIVKILVFEELN